jgi:hypothetical protein
MNSKTYFKIISYSDSSTVGASNGAEAKLNSWAKEIQENLPISGTDHPTESVQIISATPTMNVSQPHITQNDVKAQVEQELYTVTILLQYVLHFGHIRA